MQWFNKTTMPFRTLPEAVMCFPEAATVALETSMDAAERDGVTGLTFDSAILRPLTDREAGPPYEGSTFCVEVIYMGGKA